MKRALRALSICALATLIGSGAAYAKDAVMASVTPSAGQPQPVVVENGTTQSQGTYAIGTIHVSYVVEAYEFPVGDFSSFLLGLRIQANAGNPPTAYPVNPLTLEQTGSSNLVLVPQTAAFIVGGAGWSAETPVTIRIPDGVANTDGTTLVGNLQLRAPNGSHLDTVTTVQVKITLVHPTACLRVYDFVTDPTLAYAVDTLQVNVNTRRQTISSTNPYGQLSNNVLVVNTCATSETFDARIVLDPYFSTSPSGNPGNAVFTFSSASEVDGENLSDVLAAAWTGGTSQGQSLCLPNVTLPAHSSWLATVKMAINNGSSSGLGTGGTFGFGAELLEAGAACTGVSNALAAPPNPATASVTYTVK